MQITHAQNQSDLLEIADLKGKIFKRATYFEFYEERMRFQMMDPWFKPEHVLIIRKNGQIISQVTIFERPLRFGPAIVKLAGIGDVLTIPECRGKGYSGHLMNVAMEYMKNNRFDLTMLFGIPNYYHKFGYIEAMNFYQLELFNTNLKLDQSKYFVREFTPDDLPAMLQLYQANIRHCHLVVDRTVKYLQSKVIHPAHLIILTDSANRLVGYANVWDPISNRFTVIEAISENQEVSWVLLSEILKRKPDTDPSVTIKMSPHIPFVRHIRGLGSELRIRYFREGEGKGMLAIIDLCQLMQKLKPLLNARLAASRFYHFSGRLEIQSQQSIELLFENGILQTCKPAPKPSTVRSGLVADFRYFTRNLIGYWSIQDLLNQSSASISDKLSLDLLEILFPETNPFLLPWDYF